MGCNSFDREKGRVSVCAHFALFVYIYCSVRSFKKLIFHHFYCSYNGLYVLFSFNMAIVHSLLLLVVGAVCCHKPIWLPHWSNINPIRANSWANNINCHVMKYMRELEVPMWVCVCVNMTDFSLPPTKLPFPIWMKGRDHSKGKLLNGRLNDWNNNLIDPSVNQRNRFETPCVPNSIYSVWCIMDRHVSVERMFTRHNVVIFVFDFYLQIA